jgi:hypothetical protein
MGAMTGIRNPKGHEAIKQNDPIRTLQYLIFADLLGHRIDEANVTIPETVTRDQKQNQEVIKKVEVQEDREVRTKLRNLLSEIEYNFQIVNPSFDVRICSCKFELEYFGSIQDDDRIVDEDLRALYDELREQNRYIAKLIELSYEGFRDQFWLEFQRWQQLCGSILSKIQPIRTKMKTRLEELNTKI